MTIGALVRGMSRFMCYMLFIQERLVAFEAVETLIK